jgi:hypothetical protein
MLVTIVAALAISAVSGSPPQPSMDSYFAAHYEAYENTSSPENPSGDVSQVAHGQVAVDHAKGIIQIINRTNTRTGVSSRSKGNPLFEGDGVPLTLRYDCNTQSKQEVEYFPNLICKNTSLPIASHHPTREQCENWAASLFSPIGFGNLTSPDCDHNGHACDLYRNGTLVGPVNFDGRSAQLWTTMYEATISPQQHAITHYNFTVDPKTATLLAWQSHSITTLNKPDGTTLHLVSFMGAMFYGIVQPSPESSLDLPAALSSCPSVAPKYMCNLAAGTCEAIGTAGQSKAQCEATCKKPSIRAQ